MRRLPQRGDGRPLRPLTPIFYPRKRVGAPIVDGTPITPIPCVPSLSIHASEDYDGNTDTVEGNAVVVDGDYAYVGSWYDRLNVFDISDPATPTLVGSITGDSDLDLISTIIKDGDYLYVTAHDADTLVIVDVSTPSSPTKTGVAYDTGSDISSPDGVVKVGDWCYVSGFQVTPVNVSNPASPSIGTPIASGTINTCAGLAQSGDYLYVCLDGATDGIAVVDISTPGSPTHVTTLTDGTNLPSPSSVIVDGDYLYVSNYDGDIIAVVDISTPSSPSVVTGFADSQVDGAWGMVKSGDYLYVAASDARGVAVLDVSDHGSISVVDFVTDAVDDVLFDAISLALSGQYLFVGAYNFVVVDTGCA